ncbi:MAG: methionyl-tRNA formyltransferase [Xenococcaceae cyanobacterium]
MQIILVGAVDSTKIALETLVKLGAPPAALFTLPPNKAARHSDYIDLEPIATQYGIPTEAAINVNSKEVLDRLRFYQPDYILVIGWSQICLAEFLSIAKVGAIGCHPALLPENRGRAVVPWTILQRVKQTGLSLFWLDEGADSGDLILQKKISVADDETATTLYAKHCDAIANLLAQLIPFLEAGKVPRIPQQHDRATYCAKRVADDGLIDWNLPADEVWTLIRAVTKPYPGAFTFYKGKQLTIWSAEYIGKTSYWGLPGQIQIIDERGVLVQCGDRQHILVKDYEFVGEAEITLKIHDKLGIDLLSIYRSLRQQF